MKSDKEYPIETYAADYIGKLKFSVIPLKPKGKEPDIKSWKQYINTSPAFKVAVGWFRGLLKSRNIGIVTGKVSGIIVLDLDGRHGGYETIKKYKITKTATVKTKDGLHFYFRYPKGYNKIKNATNLLPGLDLKSDGGYVVAPPSIHPDGPKYIWELSPFLDCEIAECPDWLLKAIKENEVSSSKKSKKKSNNKSKEDNWLCNVIFGVVEGSRNETATKLAGLLLGRNNTEYETLQWLKVWNKQNDPPLIEDDLEKVVKSIGSLENVGKSNDNSEYSNEPDVPGMMNFRINKIIKLEGGEFGSDSLYDISIWGKRARMTSKDLLNFQLFREIIMKATNKVPMMKKHNTNWPKYIHAILESRLKIEQMPLTASKKETLKDAIREILYSSSSKNAKVLLDRGGVYENETVIIFSFRYLHEKISRHGHKVDENEFTMFLKSLGSKSVSKRIKTDDAEKKSHVVTRWRIPKEKLKSSIVPEEEEKEEDVGSENPPGL